MRFCLRIGCTACGLLAAVLLVSAAHAQDSASQQTPGSPQAPAPPQAQTPLIPPSMHEQFVKNPNAPCVQPPPGVRLEDYRGPFAKTVGIFARRLERRSVHPPHPPHYKPGVLLCTLQTKDEFKLFVTDSTDPVTFLSAGFYALIAQAENGEPKFGQGFAGYGKRFGANLAWDSSSALFKDFLYPTIFAQDPRYYRLAHGPVRKRLLHALEHSVVAHKENGGKTFNAIEWFGTASTTVLSNTYLPNNRRGFGPAAESVASQVANDAGFDVLREFWPEIAKKFKLPFRDRNEPQN